MTGIYTFRMIFRAFWGDPVPEAREMEAGHPHHAEQPFNPGTHEVEDTDVGFPGPEHAIAEREFPMKLAMGILAVLATVAGLIQIPGVDSAVTNFLHPTFAASKYADVEPSTGAAWLGLVVGAVVGLSGIFIAFTLYVRRPGTSARLIERLRPVHTFLFHKWYFDEAIDLLFVRPALGVGRFAQSTFERVFVEGTLIGGTTGLVRAGSAAVRALQTGFLRYYAALLLLGITATGLYFLIRAS
jgi:NADH-quinone oxidoreductase subunit L